MKFGGPTKGGGGGPDPQDPPPPGLEGKIKTQKDESYVHPWWLCFLIYVGFILVPPRCWFMMKKKTRPKFPLPVPSVIKFQPG